MKNTNTIGIVIPAYNEADNVPKLLTDIYQLYPDAIVVIVDDSDKIHNKILLKNISEKQYLRHKSFQIISRNQKSGRGDAVLQGLKILLKVKSVQYFFEMDADLAHTPDDMPKFIHEMNTRNTDMVLGSRYIQKSTIIKWPIYRLILSKCINYCLNIILGLRLSDYTNGFRLYNRAAINFLITINLREKGFIMLSEIAYRLKQNNFIISEVPIQFSDRKFGKSSANMKEFINSFIGILRIRLL